MDKFQNAEHLIMKLSAYAKENCHLVTSTDNPIYEVEYQLTMNEEMFDDALNEFAKWCEQSTIIRNKRV